jgi:RNA polymerase-binding transcription factor DksA
MITGKNEDVSMEKQFLSDRYYPVDIRLGIIYDDPSVEEAECGLGSKKYHGFGTIGIKGLHLSTSEMYQDFRVEPASTEPSPAYLKWEKSGFHTFINPEDGLDTQPMRPSGLDILRNCTHTTDGTVCLDCLRKAAEAEKVLMRERTESIQSGTQSAQKSPLSGKNLFEDAEEQETEILSPSVDIDDETVLSDPIEAALMRLEFGSRPEGRSQDVAVVRAAMDKTFSLQQQLTESQRNMRRALMAEIQRTAEDTEQLIEKLSKMAVERENAYRQANQAQQQLTLVTTQRDKLIHRLTDRAIQRFYNRCSSCGNLYERCQVRLSRSSRKKEVPANLTGTFL